MLPTILNYNDYNVITIKNRGDYTMKLREPMPELNGATAWLNGEVTKSELVGDRPTLIHFWSVSCGMCKEAMPDINNFRDEYKDKLNVIAVHMPRSEKDTDLETVKEVAAEHDITQPIFVDSAHKLTDAFENQYVPAYYVFDREGNLRHFQAGGSGMKMLTKRVNRVLGEEPK
jgi:thiol-disulfide isomerase/thioredoxin